MSLALGDVVPIEPKIVEAKRIAANNLAAASEKFASDMEAWAGWFLVAVRSGYEQSVEAAMLEAGVKAWVPMYDEERILKTRRRKGKRNRKLKTDRFRVMAFPGYLAVWVVPSPHVWHALHSFENVIGLLPANYESWGVSQTQSDMSHRLSRRVVDRIRRMEVDPTKDFSTIHRLAKLGQSVRVLDGPFQGLQGVVTKYENGMAVAWVSVEMFGRSTPVELWLDQFEECS